MGFKALGLTVFPADNVDQARHTLHRIAKEDFAVVYLTKTFFLKVVIVTGYLRPRRAPRTS